MPLVGVSITLAHLMMLLEFIGHRGLCLSTLAVRQEGAAIRVTVLKDSNDHRALNEFIALCGLDKKPDQAEQMLRAIYS